MASRKISISNRTQQNAGFTLIELLIVLSIISMIVGATLFFDVNSYRGDAFRAERDSLTIALQTARADAMNNIDEKKHGVKIVPSSGYVMFEGDSYATRDTTKDDSIPSSYTIALDPSSPTEIVFDQLSGDANYDGDIILKDPQRNMTLNIVINHEGKIGS